MKTKNTKLLNKKANREYYAESDKHYMPLPQAMFAHQVLDRVAWARKWAYDIGARTLLDIGTKDGYLPLTLTGDGIECVGIDPSEDAIDEARLKAGEVKKKVKYIVGFAEDLPDIRADVVTALEVIEHVVDPDVFLKKLSQVGAYVLISTPDIDGRHGMKDSERNEEHLRIYSKEELEKLMSKYGEIVESVIRDSQICILLKTK